MDSFEFNKIAGWFLAALVALLGISIATDGIFRRTLPERPGIEIAGVEEEVAGPAAEAEKPIAFYLASANVERGEAQFKKCAACHNIDKGGANGIGPNLYGIVGAPHASRPGFGYSEVLTGMKGKPWTWDELSAWLASPKTYAPGTKMAFAGIGKPEDRAAVMVYLNSKSDSPLTLPPPPADAAASADNAAPVTQPGGAQVNPPSATADQGGGPAMGSAATSPAAAEAATSGEGKVPTK